MWNPIRMAVFGSITDIKNLIVEKSSQAYNKAKTYVNNKRGNSQQENNEEPKYENNPPVNVIDR